MTTTAKPLARSADRVPMATVEGAIRWFEDIGAGDAARVGGKGANLGELRRMGMPVPPGFVVAAGAFTQFLGFKGARQRIQERLAGLDVDDSEALENVSTELQREVHSLPMPAHLRREVVDAYLELGRRNEVTEPFVAVRSSATAEDMPGTSFAGMNESFLNVRGEEALLKALRGCWESLYGARVIFYRRKQGIPEERMAIAVVVQQMVDSESAGVMFTVNPTNGDNSAIVIEGAFGFGDTVVSGRVSPDHWEVDKTSLKVNRERLGEKHLLTYRDEQGLNHERELDAETGDRPSLTAIQVREVAALGRQIEEHYGTPQDVEWAIAGGLTYIVQSRPLTALSQSAEATAPKCGGLRAGDSPGDAPEILARGLGASPAVASGPACLVTSPAEGGKLQPGDVLLARMTAPDWTPLMKKAAGIVTDEGGMTAHAAIVSRELGIPCVVGTQDATKRIADGTVVTVDGRQGLVYRGSVHSAAATAPVATDQPSAFSPPSSLVTATRLYVNLGQPELAEKIAGQDVDGVGLLRIEFMVQNITNNIHPRKMLNDGRGTEFRDRLADQLEHFARVFSPRPVVARTTDFRSNEYRNMVGGQEFEPDEANPMIGYRGAFRYVKEPDLFRLELEAFYRVREELGLKNLVLMLPFVRTLSELVACRKLMDDVGLTRDPEFPLWVMAEVPSVVYWLPRYIQEGVRGVSIGSNDLTQLMLGVDRDSQVLAPLFNERDPAVLDAIHNIILECRKHGITCSICGQAPSVYPELTKSLVEWGIDSISVNPDVIDQTRRLIAVAEQRLLLDEALIRLADRPG